MKTRKKAPEIILRNGEPAAVILDIDHYRDMLERLEDLEYLRLLEELRQKPLKGRKLSEFLEEYQEGV